MAVHRTACLRINYLQLLTLQSKYQQKKKKHLVDLHIVFDWKELFKLTLIQQNIKRMGERRILHIFFTFL